VVGAYNEATTPKVRPPMADSLHQPNEFALIWGHLQMTDHEWLAKEGERLDALVKDFVKSSRWCTGTVESASLSAVNAFVASSVHKNPSLCKSCVRGAAKVPKSLMKHR
jgi:hypothetical protein